MTLEELVAEGDAMARTAYLLSAKPAASAPAAHWSGMRADMPNETPAWATALARQRHLCTLSEELLDCLDLRRARPTGPVSLFDVELATGEHKLRASGDGRQRFADLIFSEGTPLHATSFQSFPPFAALCCHGSERVAEWLASQGYARHEYWHLHGRIVEDYEQEWMRRSFLHHPPEEAAMIVGGWHFLWPEDDYYVPPECRLLFLTLSDPEPWYEVWLGLASGGLIVRERIT